MTPEVQALPEKQQKALICAEAHWSLAAISGNKVLVFSDNVVATDAAAALFAAGITSAPLPAELAGGNRVKLQTSMILDKYMPSKDVSADDLRGQVTAALVKHLG